MNDQDVHFMRLALKEAKKGIGRTSPNPCVGAVIVKDGEIVGRGYHKKAGTPHAEIHALNAVGQDAKGATMYVTLEPCNHTGRTPPCSHAVANAGISRVVVGMCDPNPLVDGTGIDYLRGQGVEVVSGVLEQECEAINRPFIKYITTGMPWVVMKAGVSLDGKINYHKGQAGWITGAQSLEMVHKLRDANDAIMIGRSTAQIDNPSLTTRRKDIEGRDPVRIILDTQLSLPPDLRVFTVDSTAKTIVFCSNAIVSDKVDRLKDIGVVVKPVRSTDSGLELRDVLLAIGKEGITSVLVEGGGALHGALLNSQLYDYANLFMAPLFAGENGISLISGYNADNRDAAVRIIEPEYTQLGEDIMVCGQLRYT